MRIGILTVPFNNNYGGFLQAYALTQILERKGHEVTIINRRKKKITSLRHKVKESIKYILGRSKKFELLEEYHTKKISLYTDQFVRKYFTFTSVMYSSEELKNCDFDFYIVGSDQVWRYNFVPSFIDDYFFGFIEDDSKPRISYAASFGTDNLEYNEEKRVLCARLLRKFKAISVREKSGVKLLTEYFNVLPKDVIVTIDPTMLLSIEDYAQLFSPFLTHSRNYMFSYILDEDDDRRKAREFIRETKGCSIKEGKAQSGRTFEQKTIAPVESWLAAIYESEFVFTDSFHGTVFSILFNKPFIVYGNIGRGKARFDSLLSMFGLEDRYINNFNQLSESMIMKDIDWNKINSLLNIYRKKSMVFLDNSLEK